jgi:hypothetical protein
MDLSSKNKSPHIAHFHRAYGLNLLSSVSVPGLAEEHADIPKPDIILELGYEPDWVTSAIQLPSIEQCSKPAIPEAGDPAFTLNVLGNKEFFELAYSDGTRFVVDRTGQQIWGTYPPTLTIEDLATYLLGPIMGFVLRRRDVLSLHASAVCIDGQAVVLCGESASGKSTTAAALALQGIPVLCEDIAALIKTDDRLQVEAGYPRVCLWPNAVRDLYGSADALPLLTPTWEKRYLPLDGGSAKFEPSRRPLSAIYLLAPRAAESDAPRIEDLSTREALLELIQNTYMNRMLDRTQRRTEFDLLSKIVTQVPVRRIVPHTDAGRIGVLCDLIISDAQRLITHQDSVGLVPFH